MGGTLPSLGGKPALSAFPPTQGKSRFQGDGSGFWGHSEQLLGKPWKWGVQVEGECSGVTASLGGGGDDEDGFA